LPSSYLLGKRVRPGSAHNIKVSDGAAPGRIRFAPLRAKA
jgi:hypothetical protein